MCFVYLAALGPNRKRPLANILGLSTHISDFRRQSFNERQVAFIAGLEPQPVADIIVSGETKVLDLAHSRTQN